MFMNYFILFFLIFAICFLLIFKIKIHVNIFFEGTDGCIKIKIGFIKITKKFGIFTKKMINGNAKKGDKITFSKIKSVLRYIELYNFDTKIKIGLILMFPTLFSVPLLSMLIEQIRKQPFKRIKNFEYSILPVYNDLKLIVDTSFILKIRFLDVLKILASEAK